MTTSPDVHVWHEDSRPRKVHRSAKGTGHDEALGRVHMEEASQLRACDGVKVVLLSLFDGIGTTALALRETGALIIRHLAWEIDPICVEITK